MSITFAMKNGQVGEAKPEPDREPDWVSCNGTVGSYYSPQGEPVEVWRQYLEPRLLPCVYLQLTNGSDVAGFAVAENRDDGLWYEYLVASCADHRQGPWPNAVMDERVDGVFKLGWIDWESHKIKTGYDTAEAAEKAARARAAEYRSHANTKSYRKAMGLGKNDVVDVQYLGRMIHWTGTVK